MQKPEIVLALSGGGVRSMAFHLGVLTYLAENNAFCRIKAISTVSGGTLLTGLILVKNNFSWPTAEVFNKNVQPKIFKILEKGLIEISEKKIFEYTKSRFKENLWLEFKTLFSKTKKADSFKSFSEKLQKDWGINGRLNDLELKKGCPNWIINGTSAETGKRAYFDVKAKKLKCHEAPVLERLNAARETLADIVAMSAAVPGFIGPYKPVLPILMSQINSTTPGFIGPYNPDDEKCIAHIYDGGIYDNLGTEEFLQAGNGELKNSKTNDYKNYKDCVLLISDAGAPLNQSFPNNWYDYKRILKVYQITAEQVRNLRVRDFNQNFLNKQRGMGAHFRIGEKIPSSYNNKNSIARNPHPSKEEKWQSKKEVDEAARINTSIRALTEREIKILHRHGYESASYFTKKMKVKGLS